jgi:hypothetical protein
MFMKGAVMLYISLSLGYVLCILAKKQEGVLKTLGYALGVAILVMSLGHALLISYTARAHGPWGAKHCMVIEHSPDCPHCKAMK